MTLIFIQSVYVKIIRGMSRRRREESKHKKDAQIRPHLLQPEHCELNLNL